MVLCGGRTGSGRVRSYKGWMLDALNAIAQPAPAATGAISRHDYRPPAWLVPETRLVFDLDPAATRVTATLSVTRNDASGDPLRLDGAGQRPLAVRVDGVATDDWRIEGEQLVVPLTGDAHTIETEVEIAPERNTQLMGLYASGGILCTHARRRASAASPISPTGPTC
jgi:aminopeptidase N